MRNDFNSHVESCEDNTVSLHSPPIYISRTTVTLDIYVSSVYICYLYEAGY